MRRRLLVCLVVVVLANLMFCQISPTLLLKIDRWEENDRKHSCFLIERTGKFRWEATSYSNSFKGTTKVVEGQLSQQAMSDLNHLIDSEPLSTFERPNFFIPPNTSNFMLENAGAVEIHRPDRLQRIVYGTVFNINSPDVESGKAKASNHDAESDKELQPLWQWAAINIQKPFKHELVEGKATCGVPGSLRDYVVTR